MIYVGTGQICAKTLLHEGSFLHEGSLLHKTLLHESKIIFKKEANKSKNKLIKQNTD